MPPSASRPYHHGDLRAALLGAAADEIAEVGPAAASLRRIAGRAGVSHTAAAHHFKDKRGLLTAFAAEGHRRLTAALEDARPGGMVALGAAYIRFAHDHRPWFDVMFRPELLRPDDPEFAEASRSSFGELRGAAASGSGGGRAKQDLAHAAWSLVHGMTVLWLAGNLPAATVDEAVALFRRYAKALSSG